MKKIIENYKCVLETLDKDTPGHKEYDKICIYI